MSKKAFTCFLTVLLVFCCCGPVSRAEQAAEGQTASNAGGVPDGATQEPFSYEEYINSTSFPPATEDIVIQARQLSADKGAGISVKSYAGSPHDVVVWESEQGSLEWQVTIPQDGLYNLGLLYYALPGRGAAIRIAIQIDGRYPFTELRGIELDRLWKNAGAVRVDYNGNQFAPEQEEAPGWYTKRVTDPKGLTPAAFRIALSAGVHTLSIAAVSEPFALDSILLSIPEDIRPYDEVSRQYAGKVPYQGDSIPIQGQDAVLKTSNSLIAKSDMSDPGVYPSSPFTGLVNYIGSTNWQQPGQRIEWTMDIPSDGLYKLGFHYRQSFLLNCYAYRKLEIDGEALFQEAQAIGFPYTPNWSFLQLEDANGEPYLLYLTEGTHTLSLEVTMGPMAAFNRQAQAIVARLGTVYRHIAMITGPSPDANRDYALFGQIPNLQEDLEQLLQELDGMNEAIRELTGERGSSNGITLSKMAAVIRQLLDNPYRAHRYVGEFYGNYCSLSSWVNEMKDMPLDLDRILLAAPDDPIEQQTAGFFERLVFSAQRFFASFLSDYTAAEGLEADGGDSITLWLNWGRDQVQVLSSMIQQMYTPQYHTQVNLKITNASLIQAILSGNGPDCSLMLSRAQPVNLAMRGALYDLKEFADFETVTQRFMPTATTPYEMGSKCYALPDSQQFSMLFCRTDILQELGLEPPETWDELIAVSNKLALYNMQVGLPYTQITDMAQTDAGMGALNLFPTLLNQFGADLYNPAMTATNLTSMETIDVFTYWTDFYTKYGFPLTYDLYNRFRTGEIPIAVSGYGMYATLKDAAPEIEGRWSMFPIPGVRKEDGTIDNAQAAGGTGAVILSISDKKDRAWSFLKWWTSEEAQYRYSTDLESILGVLGRHSTANVQAFSRMAWEPEVLAVMTEQWKQVRELPEIAGGYYVSRILDQAFWNTVSGREIPQDVLVYWSRFADMEIAKKQQEYAIQPLG